MLTITIDAETKLNEILMGIRDASYDNYAIHFHLSKLQENNRSTYQIKIALNIISSLFKDEEGGIFLCENSDIIILYKGKDKKQLEKVIFQVRYLFIEDPLAYTSPGVENQKFCKVYDLEFQWTDFAKITKQHYVEHNENTFFEDMMEKGRLVKLKPNHLVTIEKDLKNADITPFMRYQPICVYSDDKNIKPIFHEMFISITQIKQQLAPNVDLYSNKTLFKYLTTLLDQRVLTTIARKGIGFLKYPLSMNLNVNSLFSDEFIQFDSMIKTNMKSSIVIEIHIADVFEDIQAYITAQKSLQRQGYRVCLDGLNIYSLLHINRAELGFNLAKLIWNADDASYLERKDYDNFKKSVEICGKNRLILCRCDSRKAIEYGKTLGLSLFQGRYIDKVLNPDSKVVN